MIRTRIILAIVACTASVGLNTTAFAQLPDGIGDKLKNTTTQSQVQQRINSRIQQQVQQRAQAEAQAQIQSQVQSRIQSQMQSQVQARLQADVARAAGLANRAMASTRQNAMATQNRANNAARIGTNANARIEANGNAQASANANANAKANANPRSAIFNSNTSATAMSETAVAAGFTEADVQLYDRIFGKFNPVRGEHQHSDRGASTTVARTASAIGAQNRNGSEVQQATNIEAGVDLAARIHTAIQQRRAEISEMRDKAIADSNAELMAHADASEKVIDMFVSAQAQARSQNEASLKSRTDAAAAGSGNSNGDAAAGAKSNSQQSIRGNRGKSEIRGQGNLQGSGSTRTGGRR